MAKEKLLLFVIALLLQVSLPYQVIAGERVSFKKEDLDFAKNLAKRARIEAMSAIKQKWLELKNMQQVSELAEQSFANSSLDFESDLGMAKMGDEQILLKIFVSSSMSREQLKYYLQQAKKYGAVLVFNGLPDGSWRKLSSIVYEITGGSDDGGALQIDDLAFKEYGISLVPSFVLAKEFGVFSKDFEEGRNNGVFDKVSGNIGIRRALELISDSGELADEARELLEL